MVVVPKMDTNTTNAETKIKRKNGVTTSIMEKKLRSNDAHRKLKSHFFWGVINAIVFCVILYDIYYTCPLYSETFRSIELGVLIVFGINTLFNFGNYIWMMYHFQMLTSTPLKSSLSCRIPEDSYLKSRKRVGLPENFESTLHNLSSCSWMSDASNTSVPEFDNSKVGANYSLSTSWIYTKGAHKSSPQLSPAITSHTLYQNKDIINDDVSLSQYLKDYNSFERSASVRYSIEQPSNLLSTFWSHPVTRSPTDTSPMLRKCAYQTAISSPSAEQVTNINCSSDEPGLSSPCDAEIWRRNKINSNNVIQWTANLRMWISKTILDRVVSEIKSINALLPMHGFVDVCIGEVGLDRLRKTAQTPQVVQNIPSLPCLVPFLEISPNQEYIVKRIKELTSGGCMSEFKWNGGGFIDGKDWGEHLPTDAALVLHLWATYLDSQLPPLPSTPDSRPFSSLYLIKHPNKLTKVPLAISLVTENPPHYQLVTGEGVHYVPKGRNNLFHTILLFLHQIKIKEHGMLGRMNLGRSGVNMLWVVDS